MAQVVQIVGAVIILTAFVLSQQGRLRNDSATYLAVVSAVGLVRSIRPADA
jgi:hypothetical protein